MPSPPLNPVNTDFQWPTTAAPPATKIRAGGTPKYQAANTAAAPLATSPTKTRTPVRCPTLKNTFAVPAKVLPVVKTSIPRIREAMWANGRAPSR